MGGAVGGAAATVQRSTHVGGMSAAEIQDAQRMVGGAGRAAAAGGEAGGDGAVVDEAEKALQRRARKNEPQP